MDHVLAWTIGMIFCNLCSSYGLSTCCFNHQNDPLKQMLFELSKWFIQKNVVLILWKVHNSKNQKTKRFIFKNQTKQESVCDSKPIAMPCYQTYSNHLVKHISIKNQTWLRFQVQTIFTSTFHKHTLVQRIT